MTDLWPRLEPLLAAAERPARYLNHEFGCVYKPEADFRFCMVYPDTYELGQANQALRILVNVVNAVDGMVAERAFLPAPAMCDTLRAEGIPLFSIESCAPLSEFDAVGITLPHELAATNILETLDLAGIPLHPDERGETDPLVVGGGPCAYNPEPYALFFDAFNIGEGEEALPRGLAVIRRMRAEGARRADILRALAVEPGWYVPSLYRWRSEEEAQEGGSWIEPVEDGLPTRIEKSLFEGFATSPGWEPCIVPFTEVVHDRLNVEILRGCARGCRFCQAGMMYRPVRERSADNVVESVVQGLAETGYDEVSLTSLSSTDHSQIADILTRINRACDGKGVRISVPSQRLDSFGVDMAELVAGRKKGGLTFAPEAGTQRLRNVINKNVTEDDLFGALDAAFAAGWRRCKLYFMIGLPTETDERHQGHREPRAARLRPHEGGHAARAARRPRPQHLVRAVRAEGPDAVSVGRADSSRGSPAPREPAAQLGALPRDRRALARPGHELRRGGDEPGRPRRRRVGGSRLAPRRAFRRMDRVLQRDRLARGRRRGGHRPGRHRADGVSHRSRHAVGAHLHRRVHALLGARAPLGNR